MGGETHLEGRTIGRYRIGALLGEGGMGRVYGAHDTHLGRPVAVKTIRDLDHAAEGLRLRFAQEIRSATAVTHPYVASVYDALEVEGLPLLVMELLEGTSLDRALREAGRFESKRALVVAQEIAEALAAIHGAGIVHRDLKPGNVMLTTNGHVKVMDFGVARVTHAAAELSGTATTSAGITRPGVLVGTPAYFAPEVLLGHPPTARADLFALGVLLWEMLTGRHPFRRDNALDTQDAVLYDEPGAHDDAARAAFAALPAPVRAVAEALLTKRAEDRLPTAQAAVAAIASALDGTDFRTGARGDDASPVKPWWASRAIVAAVLLFAVGAGALAWRATHLPAAEARTELPPVVAVLPFEDRSGDTGAEDRGAMIAALLGAGLGESGAVRAVAAERVDEVLAAADAGATVRERVQRAAELAGAAWIVSGQIFREGDRLHAAISVHDATAPDTPAGFRLADASSMGLVDAALYKVVEAVRGRAVSSQELAQATRGARDERAVAALVEAQRAARALDYETAIVRAEEAVDIAPNDIGLRLASAEILDSAGYETRARLAVREARRLADASPPDAISPRDGLELRILEARFGTEPQRVVDALEEAARRAPYDASLWSRVAAAMVDVGKMDQALAAIDRAVALDRLDPRLHIERARLLAKMQRSDEAEASRLEAKRLFDVLRSRHGEAEVILLAGEIAWASGKPEESLTAFREAITRFEQAGSPVDAALASRSAGDLAQYLWRLEEALDLYHRALTVLQTAGNRRAVIRTQIGIGTALQRRLDLDEARAVLTTAAEDAKSLGLARQHLIALENLIMAVLRRNLPDEALARIDEALDLAKPLNESASLPGLTRSRGEAYRLLGEYEQAEATLVNLVRELVAIPETMGADTIWTYQSLAKTREDVGDLQGAIRAATDALRLARAQGLKPSEAWTLALRARLYAAAGDTAAARADLAELQAIDDGSGGAREFVEAARLAEASLALARLDWNSAISLSKEQAELTDFGRASEASIDLVLVHARALLSSDAHREADRLLERLRAEARLTPAQRRTADRLAAERG